MKYLLAFSGDDSGENFNNKKIEIDEKIALSLNRKDRIYITIEGLDLIIEICFKVVNLETEENKLIGEIV